MNVIKNQSETTGGAPLPEPLIRCNDLKLGYGRETILRNVNLEIPAGVFLPFVGPNGAGKTTLLRAILGILRPLGGTIQTPFAISPPGYVPQQKRIDPLYPVSALDIVMMGFYRQTGWRNRNRDLYRVAAIGLLARFDLAEHAHKTFDELSGGMRQKVLIARALAGDPSVLIMDEPTTELDHRAQQDVMDVLRQAVETDGRTVLLVHHGLDVIEDLACNVCLVRGGDAVFVPVQEARF